MIAEDRERMAALCRSFRLRSNAVSNHPQNRGQHDANSADAEADANRLGIEQLTELMAALEAVVQLRSVCHAFARLFFPTHRRNNPTNDQ